MWNPETEVRRPSLSSVCRQVLQRDIRRLLEVGALKPDNFRSCASWIDVTPIDLRSQHPDIIEQDFLLLDPAENRCRWDMLSLSLVLNFVPNASDRGNKQPFMIRGHAHINVFPGGRMLQMAHDMLVDSGLLFLVVSRTLFMRMMVSSFSTYTQLPLPCVENSRYLTFDHLDTLMRAIGFAQLRSEWRKNGKMAYWLYRKTESCDSSPPPVSVEQLQKKVVLRQGNRNNFCILLSPI